MTSLIRRDAVNTRPGKNPLSLRAILEHASVGKPKHHIGEVSLPDRELYTVHEFKSINGWISRRFYYKNGVIKEYKREWFVQNIDSVDSNKDELNRLKSFFFDPSTTAIINKDQLNSIEEFEYDSTATINLLASKDNYKPSRLVYKTSDLKSNQLAVFSEIYYPKGWRVYIDGEEVDYFRVNYLLRGLMIPKGEHEVVFEFKPNSFYVGNKIALSSSIIFLITFFTVLVYYLKPGLLNNIYSSSEV